MTHRIPKIGEIWINELDKKEIVKIVRVCKDNYWFECQRYKNNKFTKIKWGYNIDKFKNFIYDERLNNELMIQEIIE